MRSTIGWFGGALVLVGLVGCSDGSGPNGGQRVGLMVSTAPAGAASAPGFAPESVKVGSHTLVFEKVELVLREIELKRVAGTGTCGESSGTPSASSGSGGDHDGGNEGKGHHDGEHKDCFDFEVGPFLLDLPLGITPQRVVTIDVDTGNYREVEFKIHRPTNSSEDQQLLTDHPDFAGISVRATGTFDGTAFTYTSKVTARQENELTPPLVVGAQGATDLTLQVEIGSWFLAGGIGLLDPATANPGGPNEGLVAQNIRRSFRVFEDRNHDGHEDR